MAEKTKTVIIESIPIEKIRSSRHQARKVFPEAGIIGLSGSIKLEGLIQPVTVRPVDGGWELISGERRLLAVKRLGWKTIEARIIQPVSEGEVAAKGLIENLQRENLNPMEEAEGLAELNRLDPVYWTQAKIAEIAGKKQSHISEMLRLLDLSDKVKDFIRRRIIMEGHAVELLRLPSQQFQDKVAEQIKTKDLGVHETRAVVNKLLAKAASKKAPSKEPPAGLKEDPAALLWPELKMDLRMESAGAWTVDFKKGKWFFMVDSAGVGTQEALATWFLQVGKALGKPIPAPSEDSDAPDDTETSDETDGMRAMQKRAKLPKTAEEEAELYALAESSKGPGPIYARIYGPTNPFTRLGEGKTWADFQVTDPKEALRQLLDGIRKAQEAKP